MYKYIQWILCDLLVVVVRVENICLFVCVVNMTGAARQTWHLALQAPPLPVIASPRHFSLQGPIMSITSGMVPGKLIVMAYANSPFR